MVTQRVRGAVAFESFVSFGDLECGADGGELDGLALFAAQRVGNAAENDPGDAVDLVGWYIRGWERL